ncbi:MAG: hypothetical protein QGG48_09690, partial [Desulfatiglandales bacterium]|nr:hypothetical protein [Desulfatiglandales bacterium]
MGSDPQMVWVYTFSVIASMKDKKAFGDRAIMKNVGHSVSQRRGLVFRGIHKAVSRIHTHSVPFPTLIGD